MAARLDCLSGNRRRIASTLASATSFQMHQIEYPLARSSHESDLQSSRRQSIYTDGELRPDQTGGFRQVIHVLTKS